MAKAYWIGRVDVHDPDTYKLYAQEAVGLFQKYSARILARGGRAEAVEGQSRARNIVVEFNSMDDALACFNSPEYQKARLWRQKSSIGELVLVEGA